MFPFLQASTKGVATVEQQPVLDILYIAAFFLGGLGFAVGPFVIAHLFAPRGTRNIRHKTSQSIECGIDPIGPAWIRFGVVYYLYALMFLAFDVDVLFLFPVAVAYNDFAPAGRAFVEVLIFVGILSLAIVYAWKKGVFKWDRKTYNPQ
jgi:NADH-quinone oxidoreductase subunit A